MVSERTSYQRQATVLLPAYLVMICGGMYLAYGIFGGFGTSTSVSSAFFLAGSIHFYTIIGAVLGSLAYNKFDILKIHYANCGLMIVASILMTSIPNAYAAVLIATLIFGLGFGSSYVTSIIYTSEISSPKVRGYFVFLLHFFLTFGLFIFSLFTVQIHGPNFYRRLIGGISIGLILLSIAIGFFKLKSSHIFLLHNNSNDAVERLQYFQLNDCNNPQIGAMETLVFEEKNRSFKFFNNQSLSALIVILFVQLGYLAIFNELHISTRIFYLNVHLSSFDIDGIKSYSLVAMMSTRLVGCMIGLFIVGRSPRGAHYFMAAFVASVLLLIFGVVHSVAWNNDEFRINIWFMTLTFLSLEFLVGIGLGPMADVLRSELFSLKEKPILIAATIAVGEILHIIFLSVSLPWDLDPYTWLEGFNRKLQSNPYVFGGITLICGIVALLLLKNSKPADAGNNFPRTLNQTFVSSAPKEEKF